MPPTTKGMETLTRYLEVCSVNWTAAAEASHIEITLWIRPTGLLNHLEYVGDNLSRYNDKYFNILGDQEPRTVTSC